jgi:CheY-like chemotaxis protein
MATDLPFEPLGSAASRQLPRKLRVLVADDNRDVVLTLSMLVREEGHEVQGVYNGMEALTTARMFTFDAIVLDIEMPELSGYAIARELRSFYYRSRCPLLIALTGKWNRGSEKLLSRALGFDHHFEKPCDPNRLLAALRPLSLLPPGDLSHG